MPRTLPVPERSLAQIAPQIGERIPLLADTANIDTANTYISEALPVEVLDTNWQDVMQSDTPLAFRSTDQWHLQVRVNEAPTFAARFGAETSADEAWRLNELHQGEVTATIDQALAWIDGNIEEDVLVSLLEIPSFLTTTVHLSGVEDQFIIVRSSSEQIPVDPTRALSRDELRNLLQQQGPAIGFVPESDATDESSDV